MSPPIPYFVMPGHDRTRSGYPSIFLRNTRVGGLTTAAVAPYIVMPGLVPGIHVFFEVTAGFRKGRPNRDCARR